MQASSAMQQSASSSLQQVASSANQQVASSANQQQASMANRQQASSAMQQVASSANQQGYSSAQAQVASSANQQIASSANQQAYSSAQAQVASSANQQGYSSAQAQLASSANQQIASSANQQAYSSAQAQVASSANQQGYSSAQAQVASSANQQLASSANQQAYSSAQAQVASSANQQVASSANQQLASSANQQLASSANQQAYSSAQAQVASSANQQVASSANQQAYSSAQAQTASSANQQQSSSANQQLASSANQQLASSANQQLASSANQQLASSANQQAYSSAQAQAASSANQQLASSANQQLASSARQQVASSANQQVASSANQQVASSANQQQASMAAIQQASSARQQAASSALQQVASSANQQVASSAQQQQTAISGANAIHSNLMDQLNQLRALAVSLKRQVYSTGDTPAIRQQLQDTLRLISEKEAEIFAEDAQIKALVPSYIDYDMQPIVPDNLLTAMGITKRFDIATNKYIFLDAARNLVPNPLLPPNYIITPTGPSRARGGGKLGVGKKSRKNRPTPVQWGGGPPVPLSGMVCPTGTSGCMAPAPGQGIPLLNTPTAFQVVFNGGMGATSWTAVLNGVTVSNVPAPGIYFFLTPYPDPVNPFAYYLTFVNTAPATLYTLTNITPSNASGSSPYPCMIKTVTAPSWPDPNLSTYTLNPDGSVFIRIKTVHPTVNAQFVFGPNPPNNPAGLNLSWPTGWAPAPVPATDGGGGYVIAVPANRASWGATPTFFIWGATNAPQNTTNGTPSLYSPGCWQLSIRFPPLKPVISQNMCGLTSTSITFPYTGDSSSTYTFTVNGVVSPPQFTRGSFNYSTNPLTTNPSVAAWPSGLIQGSRPTIVVTATAVNGLTAVSDPFIALTAPAQVVAKVTNITSSSVTIVWTGIEGVVYTPIVAAPQLANFSVANGTITGTGTLTYVASSLTPNTAYGASVTAANGCGPVFGNPMQTIDGATGATFPGQLLVTLPLPPSSPSIAISPPSSLTSTGCTIALTGGMTSARGVTTYGSWSYTLNGGAAIAITSTPAPTNAPVTVSLTGLTPGSSNSFVAIATNIGGTNTATLAITTPPVPPGSMSFSAISMTGFTLRWSSTNSPATTYSFTIGGTPAIPSSTATNTAIFTNLTPNTIYNVAVIATANGIVSTPSTELSVTTAPSQIVLNPTATTLSSNGFTIGWVAPTGTAPITSYSFLLGGVAPPSTPTISGNSATFTGLADNTTYSVTVTANNASGIPSQVSAPVSIITPWSAVRLQASSALQQVASSALQQVASSAVQQVASSAMQQVASSAVQQVASSAMQQVASSAVQQVASSAMQQQAIAVQQRQEASSAMQQQASSAQESLAQQQVQIRQLASSAMQEKAIVMQKQVASSAFQQQASAAVQQDNTVIQQQQVASSGATALKTSIMSDLTSMRNNAMELLRIVYSGTQAYPVTTSFGIVLADSASATTALKQLLANFSSKQAQITSIDALVQPLSPSLQNLAANFQDISTLPIVPDSILAGLGYIKRFDEANNKYIYIDSAGNIVPNPIPSGASAARGGGKKNKKGRKRAVRGKKQ